jgi:hypothetical protein
MRIRHRLQGARRGRRQGHRREALAYARVTIPLGRKPKRIDCSQIYELEIARLR